MEKHEVIQRLMEEGLPPRGFARLVIRRADGSFELSSLIMKGTTVSLEAGEEVVAEVSGDLAAQTPYFPEGYGDSDLAEKYLLKVAPEKADEWLRLYGPATNWNPITALQKLGVDEEFFASPEGEEFIRSAEAELIRIILEEVEV